METLVIILIGVAGGTFLGAGLLLVIHDWVMEQRYKRQIEEANRKIREAFEKHAGPEDSLKVVEFEADFSLDDDNGDLH